MKSLHWRKLKKIIDPVKLEMFALVTNAKIEKMEEMNLAVYYNSRLDVDNLSATCKIFVDQLVKLERLPDDSKKHWRSLRIEYKSELPHNTIEFCITAIAS